MLPGAAVFDVMGTLFDLSPLRKRLAAIGAPEGALEAWFGRTLHGATSLTLAGEYAPFADIARPMLASTLAQLGLNPDGADDVTDGLAELPAFSDTEPALARLSEAGVSIWTLTNGSEENTRGLLERNGLLGYVERIATVAEVERYKPHPDVYALVPAGACLIAAHAWDVAGARAAGLRAIWVDRIERVWPLPLPEGERAASLQKAAELLLAD